MKSHKGLLALPALSVVLLGAACGGDAGQKSTVEEKRTQAIEERSPTAVDLNGIWLQIQDPDSLGVLIRFSPDHTFAMDDGGELASKPEAVGRFQLEGRALSLTSQGSNLCADGDSWAWRASLPENGRLNLVRTEEGADPCRIPIGTEWTLVRVMPRTYIEGSKAVRAMIDAGPAEGPPPTAAELAGIWYSPEAPLVQFSPDGTFAIDNGGYLDTDPSVRGRYELKGDTITFPNVSGHACPGTSFAWQASLLGEGLLRVVTSKEAGGSCREPLGTEWTFIRVSPSSPTSSEASAEIAAAEAGD